jgi:hypothetical protein
MEGLPPRPARGLIFVVADDHAGLAWRSARFLPEAAVHRSYAAFLRNTLDDRLRKGGDDFSQIERALQAIRRTGPLRR